MQKRKDEALIIDVAKKQPTKKNPLTLQWIDGVGSQKYSIEFVKKGY